MAPEKLNLGVGKGPRLHNLAGTQLVTAVDDVHLGRKFGQKHGLLHCAVAATHHCNGLAPEERGRSVTDGTGRNALVPKAIVIRAWKVETTGDSTGGDDECLCFDELFVGPDAKGALREVNTGHGLAKDTSAKSQALLPHTIHQLAAHEALGEAGKVFHIGRGGELSAGGNAIG